MKYMSDPTYPFGAWDGTQYLGIENNVVTRFDRWVLGASHLYKGYGGIPFDPEGLLSTIPAAVTVIIGYFVGKLIDGNPDRMILVKKMFIFGVIALLLGWVLNFEFPINKPIWSSTYVIFMTGWCLVLNAVLIWVIDVQGWKGWTKPLLVLGMNSLLAFIIAGVWVKTVSKIKFDSSCEVVMQSPTDSTLVPKRIGGTQKLYEEGFSSITTDRQLLKDVKAKVITAANTPPSVWSDFVARQKLSSFLYAVFHMCLFWFFLWIFYRNNIFLKV
jgi:predicted acyltransferase